MINTKRHNIFFDFQVKILDECSGNVLVKMRFIFKNLRNKSEYLNTLIRRIILKIMELFTIVILSSSCLE